MNILPRMGLLLALGFSLLTAPLANAATAAKENGQERSQPPAGVVSLYKPPHLGAPRLRMGGGVRGGEGSDAPVIHVLAPEQLGLTTAEQPTLYWHLDKATPHVVEITLNEVGGVSPLARKELTGPVAAGLHAFRLAEQDQRLTIGKEYEWFVAVVLDQEQRSQDIIAGGGLQRVAMPDGLSARLSGLGPQAAGAAYAGAGLWYDALAAMVTGASQAPAPAELANQFQTILQQEGIGGVQLTPPAN